MMIDMDAIEAFGSGARGANDHPFNLYSGIASVLLSVATSAVTRSAIGGCGAVVPARSRRVHAMSAISRIASDSATMSRKQGNEQRGFTVEKCQDIGTGLSEVA